MSNAVRRELDDPSLLRTAAYVDGTWITTDATLAVHNPSTGDLLAEVPMLDRAPTAAAIDAAHRALPAWRARPAKERSRLLRRWFDLVTEHAEDLARLIVLEGGGSRTRRPSARSRTRRRSWSGSPRRPSASAVTSWRRRKPRAGSSS